MPEYHSNIPPHIDEDFSKKSPKDDFVSSDAKDSDGTVVGFNIDDLIFGRAKEEPKKK
jgi:hypothetical protein